MPGPPTAAPTSESASATAARAWAAVGAEPRTAQRLAVAALDAARATRDHAAASVARRALGMAALDLVGADEAVRELRKAVAAGRRAADSGLVAEAEMSLALALQHQGDAARALRHAEAAVSAAPGIARLGMQRALIQERFGQLDAALDTYRRAQRVAAATGDRDTLARIHCNRGVLLTYRGDFDRAETDILAGERLSLELGLELMAAGARSNLGYLAARRGNVVEALRWLEQARPHLRAAGDFRHGVFELDHCEVLLGAGLSRDALVAGRRAIDLIAATGMQTELAEARLLTAEAALRDGDLATAEALGRTAARGFSRQRRAPWAARAREVEVQARWESGRRDARLLNAARRVAQGLDEAGWRASASSARILAARIALELGRPQIARSELTRVSQRRSGPASERIRALHARALLRDAEGNARGARSALRAGWQIVEEHRATLGATELHVGAAAHTTELAALGIDLAARAGSPEELLRWAERGRAGALHQPPVRAPQDPRLAEALAALRAVSAELDTAAKDGEDTRALLRRQVELEAGVRSLARLVERGGTVVRDRSAIDVEALHAALGDRAFVELVVARGRLLAVVAAGGRLSIRELGDAAAAVRASAALRMALGRLAAGEAAPASLRAAARDAASSAAGALAELVLSPVASELDGRPLVLVPTGALHGTPWPGLPGVSDELVVAPSAALWLRGRKAAGAAAAAAAEGIASGAKATVGGAAPGGVLVAAGPRLRHADAEVRAVGALYPTAILRAADAATADEIRALLPSVELAHLACHGHFRDDNPLFSALEFTGGLISVFELEQLPSVPRRIVLSACDSGRAAVRPGDELIGLAAALLRLGTESLVASVLAVPDDATRRLMTAFHTRLARGATPPAALAAARAELDPGTDEDRVAAAAFVVFGSD